MRPHLVHWLDGIVPGGIAAVLAPTWFTCVGLAGVVALFAMLAIARRHRLDRGAVASIVLWCYVAAVAAGIAIPSAIDAVDQLLAGGHAQIRWAGMTSFWGYLAGGCAVAVACHAHGVPLRRFADLAVAPMGVALMLARIGCFVAGCDYGKVSSLPWAVRFPAHSPAWQDHVAAGLLRADRAESLPVHPTELYEAALGLAIAVLALGLARRRPTRDGRVFLAAAALYAIGRIAIEDLRGDAGRGIYLGLSSGQIFSLLLLATIVATIAATTRLRRLRPVAATSAVAVALTLALAAPHAHAEPAPTAAPTAPAVGASKQPFGPQLPPAQPAPQPAQPQPFGPQLPPAQPAPPGPQPAQAQPPPPPLYTPSAPPAAPPGQSSFGAAPAGAESAGGASLSIGALVGAAAPFNRRRDQVATLAGGSASIGFGYRALGAWLDLDSFANRDARHGTLLVSGGAVFRVARHLEIGGRVGVGATLVNFDDPAFRDVVGTTGRFEAMVDVRLGESWLLWIRPLALDVLSAADLGGPIATWQARLGLAYQFQFGRRTPAPALYPTPPGPPPDPAPAAAPPRAP